MLEELPEKWYVLYNSRKEFDIINNHFELWWGYPSGINRYGYSTHTDTNWVGGTISKKDLDKEGFTQLTFEEFTKYVINKESFINPKKENYNYLKSFFKKLNIK